MQPTTGTTTITIPEIYTELLAIFSDLKVYNFALHFSSEMTDDVRKELPFTGDRIIERLESVVERTSTS